VVRTGRNELNDDLVGYKRYVMKSGVERSYSQSKYIYIHEKYSGKRNYFTCVVFKLSASSKNHRYLCHLPIASSVRAIPINMAAKLVISILS